MELKIIRKKAPNTHSDGVCHKQDPEDQQKTGNVGPGSVQGGCEQVHLGVQSEQIPTFDGGKKDQERDEILQLLVGCGRVIETGKPRHTTKMFSK